MFCPSAPVDVDNEELDPRIQVSSRYLINFLHRHDSFVALRSNSRN